MSKNKKYGNFVSISSLTGECAAEKFKNWTCLHHMVILRSQNKITDFLMILAWASPFNLEYLISVYMSLWQTPLLGSLPGILINVVLLF